MFLNTHLSGSGGLFFMADGTGERKRLLAPKIRNPHKLNPLHYHGNKIPSHDPKKIWIMDENISSENGKHQIGDLCGECHLLRKMIAKSPKVLRPILQGVDACLRGISQVVTSK